MRVLVTGSRDWGNADVVCDALSDEWIHSRGIFTVVHGWCRTGADKIADEWAQRMMDPEVTGESIVVERHPAQGHPTQDFGPWPGAGPRRNAFMVSLGADVCLAFIGPCTSRRCKRAGQHPSHGASGCADLALKAGIPVRSFQA